MYFIVNFNMLFKLIKVHFLVSEIYIFCSYFNCMNFVVRFLGSMQGSNAVLKNNAVESFAVLNKMFLYVSVTSKAPM